MTAPTFLDHPADAIITLHSLRTGRTFTYRLRRAPLRHFHCLYIDHLTNLTNESSINLLGRVVRDTYYHSPASEIPPDSPITLAFDWYWRHRAALPPTISVETIENPYAA